EPRISGGGRTALADGSGRGSRAYLAQPEAAGGRRPRCYHRRLRSSGWRWRGKLVSFSKLVRTELGRRRTWLRIRIVPEGESPRRRTDSINAVNKGVERRYPLGSVNLPPTGGLENSAPSSRPFSASVKC